MRENLLATACLNSKNMIFLLLLVVLIRYDYLQSFRANKRPAEAKLGEWLDRAFFDSDEPQLFTVLHLASTEEAPIFGLN